MKKRFVDILAVLCFAVLLNGIAALFISDSVATLRGATPDARFDTATGLLWGRSHGIGVQYDFLFPQPANRPANTVAEPLPSDLVEAMREAKGHGTQYDQLVVVNCGLPLPWLGKAHFYRGQTTVGDAWTLEVPWIGRGAAFGSRVEWWPLTFDLFAIGCAVYAALWLFRSCQKGSAQTLVHQSVDLPPIPSLTGNKLTHDNN